MKSLKHKSNSAQMQYSKAFDMNFVLTG